MTLYQSKYFVARSWNDVVLCMTEPVVIVDYDPAWPDVFQALRQQVAAILGDTASAIEHVGSTAVPGLAAKPIIDLDVVVRTVEDTPIRKLRFRNAVGQFNKDCRAQALPRRRSPDVAPMGVDNALREIETET